MANKFLSRRYENNEDNYVPKQRGWGRRVFEGISKKTKKYKKRFFEDDWTEPDTSELSPQNPRDWKEMRARRARDLDIGRPPTAEEAEEYKEEVRRKLKRGKRPK